MTEHDTQVEASYRAACIGCEVVLSIDIEEDRLGANREPSYCPMCKEALSHADRAIEEVTQP